MISKRAVLLTVVVSLLMLHIAPAQARGEFELGLGIAKDIDGEEAGVATLAYLTEQKHPWEFIAGYFGQRREAGAATVEDNYWLGVSKRVSWRGLYASFGLAYAVDDNEVLSDHLQFQSAVGYRFSDFSVSLRHLSNGSTNGRNRGETFLLLHYAF